jgi:hypothetical protein
LNAGLVSSRGEGVTVALKDPSVREVHLDRATAELLEARVRALGLTLAQLLTEFAVAETPEAERLPAFKAD